MDEMARVSVAAFVYFVLSFFVWYLSRYGIYVAQWGIEVYSHRAAATENSIRSPLSIGGC